MNLLPPVKAALREHRPGLFRTLQSWPWLDTVRTLRLRFREDRLGITAASLTFTTLISLVPLVTVMLWIFSASPMFASFEDSLRRYFIQSLVPPTIAGPVLDALTEYAGKASRLGAVGLGFLLLTALTLMLTIDRALNAIWRVRTPRPIAQRVLVYWAAATLGPLLLGASLSATSYAISASRGLVSVLPGGVSLLIALLEFGLLAAGLAGLFHYVPNADVRWRHAIAGGLCAAAGFEIAKRLLAIYLTLVPTYSILYGAFAALPIFLVWLYTAWVVVLLGALVAAYAPSLQRRVRRWPDGPGARFTLALVVLRALDDARHRGQRGATGDALSAALRIDPLQIESVLDSLRQLDWVGRLDDAGDRRFVLLCDPERTPAEPLLAALLLPRSEVSVRLWQRTGFDALTLRELLTA